MGVGVQDCSGISPGQLELEVGRGLGVPGTSVAALPSTSTEELGGGPGGCNYLPPIHPVQMLRYGKENVEVAKYGLGAEKVEEA